MATATPQKRLYARLFILAALIAVVVIVRYCRHTNPPPPPAPPPVGAGHQQGGAASQNNVPTYALDVLKYVRDRGEAPPGYVGGREFQNKEKRLPAKDGQGVRIRYSEWDVRPKEQGHNRGPERLVTGSDHSAWYTKDHYKNFIKID